MFSVDKLVKCRMISGSANSGRGGSVVATEPVIVDTSAALVKSPPAPVVEPIVPAVVPPPANALPPQPPAIIATPVHAPTGACWRNAGGEWKKLPADLTLNACVQALYAGHCERQGGATYGRWIDQTLRAVPGHIEVSADNHDFRTLVEQGPGCSLPPIG